MKKNFFKNENIVKSFLESNEEGFANKITIHYNEYDNEMLLRQYGTLIAVRKNGTVTITDKKYSVTTSTLQNMIKRIAEENGFNVRYSNKFKSGGEVEGNANVQSIASNYEKLHVKEQSIEERELELFIENDGDLYRQRIEPINKNLATKMVQGKFDISKAPKIFKYLIDDGIKKYNKEYGGGMSMTKAEKENLSKSLFNTFLSDAQDGNFNKLVPKKYQKFEKGGEVEGNNEKLKLQKQISVAKKMKAPDYVIEYAEKKLENLDKPQFSKKEIIEKKIKGLNVALKYGSKENKTIAEKKIKGLKTALKYIK